MMSSLLKAAQQRALEQAEKKETMAIKPKSPDPTRSTEAASSAAGGGGGGEVVASKAKKARVPQLSDDDIEALKERHVDLPRETSVVESYVIGFDYEFFEGLVPEPGLDPQSCLKTLMSLAMGIFVHISSKPDGSKIYKMANVPAAESVFVHFIATVHNCGWYLSDAPSDKSSTTHLAYLGNQAKHPGRVHMPYWEKTPLAEDQAWCVSCEVAWSKQQDVIKTIHEQLLATQSKVEALQAEKAALEFELANRDEIEDQVESEPDEAADPAGGKGKDKGKGKGGGGGQQQQQQQPNKGGGWGNRVARFCLAYEEGDWQKCDFTVEE